MTDRCRHQIPFTMACLRCDDAERAYHQQEMAETAAMVDEVAARLKRLSIADLRVLCRKYWKCSNADLQGMTKTTLIAELSWENGEQILNDIWRAR